MTNDSFKKLYVDELKLFKNNPNSDVRRSTYA
jgi:hypothetical protein